MAKKTFEIEMKLRRHWFDEPCTTYERHCLRAAERKYEGYFRRVSDEAGLDPELVEDALNGVVGRMDRIESMRSTKRASAEWRVLHTLKLILEEFREKLEPVMKEE